MNEMLGIRVFPEINSGFSVSKVYKEILIYIISILNYLPSTKLTYIPPKGKRKIIFKRALGGDVLDFWGVLFTTSTDLMILIEKNIQKCVFELKKQLTNQFVDKKIGHHKILISLIYIYIY